MGTPITAEVRGVITEEREEQLSHKERSKLLDARRRQLRPIMKYLGAEGLVDFCLRLTDRRSIYEGMGHHLDRPQPSIKAPKGFDTSKRGLFFSVCGISSGYVFLGMTHSAQWVRVRVITRPGYTFLGVRDIDHVEVEVIDTWDFAEYSFENAWIGLSEAVDWWVEHRRELLEKAQFTQAEVQAQNKMIAPFMDAVGDGTVREFVNQFG